MRPIVFAVAAMLAAAAPPAALAQQKACVNKAGQGTAGTEEGAKFQAYEAILQATDWSMWATWMASGAKIGAAPGYKVSKLKFRCKKGGLGVECIGQATLCK
ncbi:MAG: hypothetical protein ACREC6_12920 [Hyphomicrobiaceae bacterium]